MLSNANMVSAIVSCDLSMAASTDFDTVISYLPLAHVFGRLSVYFTFLRGGSIGNFGGDVRKLADDLQILKPTIFPAVPRVLNRVYDSINKTVSESNWVKRFLFNKAVKSKTATVRKDGKVTSTVYDKLVFAKLKNKLGGRVRIIVTGSAPIAADVLEFFRVSRKSHIDRVLVQRSRGLRTVRVIRRLVRHPELRQLHRPCRWPLSLRRVQTRGRP